jgi:protein phosphatase
MPTPETFAVSDKGLVRQENEDSFLLYIPEEKAVLEKKGLLAVVADGVGGGPEGKRASNLAVEVIRQSYYSDPTYDNEGCLAMAFHNANEDIFDVSRSSVELQGMATTCTAFIYRGNKGCICHVGDSRAYLLRDKTLQQLTKDHSLVNEMIQEGIITPEEGLHHPQRNVILKVLGSSARIEPDLFCFGVEHGDVFLLSSDGLHGYASSREIADILSKHEVEQAGPRLIRLALEKGGQDNVTVVILRF